MAARLNRRSFLKGAGALGTGIMICDSSMVFGYPANERLNIAAIGVGGRGGANLGGCSSQNIVGLCDADERQAGGARGRFKKAKYFKDYRKMLSEMDKEIDAVLVSTPDHTHAVTAIQAMKQGKHVFCEKPLTRTVYESRMMRLVAQKQKVVTQMGNQGSASEGVRRATEWCFAGTVGPIEEAYLWVGDGNTALTLPKDKPPIPKEVDWDLWLGPASERPYHNSYLPRSWRPWRHFGSGGLGDMGCHTGNFMFRGLRFDTLWNNKVKKGEKNPIIKIEGQGKGLNDEGYPQSIKVVFHMPARGELPPVKLTVSSGKDVRPAKELLLGETPQSFGSLLIGSKASIYSSNPWNTSSKILKKGIEIKEPPKTIPRNGHYREFIQACKGEGETFSSFSMGGPLTELIQLSNVAALVNEPFNYDPVAGKVTNNTKANNLLHREYRKGWAL